MTEIDPSIHMDRRSLLVGLGASVTPGVVMATPSPSTPAEGVTPALAMMWRR